ncbi:outer membrane lipoprotein carrier protein LolA [Riemerella anatipestifer]|uniref:Outer membrane lipoprotein carrier protein LolA n=1 Tax=Riemerella anatipestifer TaxID=34085 RepID=A0AAP3AM04_RIEAN|nr:outer membrane lipoprotein carrier protein LolA [Riemerella anatipestifer]AZZ57789.1 outer membrane lipoprotein carrier protein LolA [Riemerella anatipestifer]MBT0572122.1 outer membrane lipoprotein carrier protein LolA [Riemerella anatipestifer]MCO7318790.1 outer membrane lipoprotein carrier protein LolA [Riemerella anatipestifer]MCQ4155090.1 outer membrane lipoprotein carrier protein LolA [Riemerella anatipestifer]MCQ4181064.1 outer membrane lipoprotein carrier protein LolA [Riemerella an
MKSILKKTGLVVLSLGAISYLSAQKVDAKAKALLDGVSANYKSKKNTYFKFSYGSGKNKVQKAETGIFYSNGSQYKLKIMGIEQIFDGKKVYNISDENQEVTIAMPNNDTTMFSPINYLDDYKKGYNIEYLGKKKISTGKVADLIRMKPTKQGEIKYVYLFVDAGKKELLKLEQQSKDNDIAVIDIKDFKYNQNLSVDIFSFNKSKYQNYIITEL